MTDAKVPPSRVERASPLQLSAMDHKVRIAKRPPYGNFATLVPFEAKVSSKRKFSVPYVVHGQWQMKEHTGPANFMEWLGSWRVFVVICRSLAIVAHAALLAYESRIEDLNRDYSEEGCWGLIYAAEDAMRSRRWTQ